VSGRVWHDLNGDGQQEKGEPGVAKLEMLLVTKDENAPDARLVARVTTGANGRYHFKPQATGRPYVVGFIVPRGASVTKTDVGNDSTDSDVAIIPAEPSAATRQFAPSLKAGAKASAQAGAKVTIATSDVFELTAKGQAIDAGLTGAVATPTTAPTSAPAPGNGGGSLPVTGAALGGLLGGGAALLAGGAAMVVITRRRRVAGATAAAE
jgi:hypothetical protein